MAYVRHETVAETFPADRILDGTALFDVCINRLSRAAVTGTSVRPPVCVAQIAEITHALALLEHLAIRVGPFDINDLEWKAGRRGECVRDDVYFPGFDFRKHFLFQIGFESTFVGEREQRSDLDAFRAG